jgi:hypothetical protein
MEGPFECGNEISGSINFCEILELADVLSVSEVGLSSKK